MRDEHKMSSRHLEPMRIIKATLHLYKKYFPAVIVAGVLLFVVSVLVRKGFDETSFFATAITVPFTALTHIFFVRYIHLYETGKNVSIFTVIRDSARYIAPGIIVYTTTFVLTMIGVFLLIIPGIIVGIMLCMAFNYVVLEDKGIKEAIDLSRKHTKGNRLNIFHAYWGLYFPFIILAALLYIVFIGKNPMAYAYSGSIFAVFTSMLMPLIGYEIYRTLKKLHTVEK